MTGSSETPADSVLPRIFLLGDSISIQYGPHLEQMLAGRFHLARKSGEEEALKNLDLPTGANGGDSSRCLRYLTGLRDTTGMQADLLLLNCGLHDVITNPTTGQRQVDLDAYRSNLQRIIKVVADLTPQLMWIRTTPVDEVRHNRSTSPFYRYARDVDRYNAAADDVMADHGIETIDLFRFTLSLGSPAELLHDGRHFHEPIQRLQAAYIAGRLDAWRIRHRKHP